MKITGAEVNKMIKRLNYEKKLLIDQEREGSCYVFVKGGTDFVPEYDFDAVQQGIEEIDRKVVILKHALNLFNSSYVLLNGETIDQGLVRMAQLENRRERLERLAKVRCRKRRHTKNGTIAEYGCANYDVNKVRKILTDIVSEIEEIQLQLDRINSTVLIDVAV